MKKLMINNFENQILNWNTWNNRGIRKYPQEYDDGGIIILDHLNEKETNDPQAQEVFRRSTHNNLSVFIVSVDYYELPKRTIRANGNIYHIFKPNNFRVVLNL